MAAAVTGSSARHPDGLNVGPNVADRLGYAQDQDQDQDGVLGEAADVYSTSIVFTPTKTTVLTPETPPHVYERLRQQNTSASMSFWVSDLYPDETLRDAGLF